MKKISKLILSVSLVLLVAFLTFNATLDMTISHSLIEETEEVEEDDLEQIEEASKKVEDSNNNSNSKILFYT